jgi:hypothetical protein
MPAIAASALRRDLTHGNFQCHHNSTVRHMPGLPRQPMLETQVSMHVKCIAGRPILLHSWPISIASACPGLSLQPPGPAWAVQKTCLLHCLSASQRRCQPQRGQCCAGADTATASLPTRSWWCAAVITSPPASPPGPAKRADMPPECSVPAGAAPPAAAATSGSAFTPAPGEATGGPTMGSTIPEGIAPSPTPGSSLSCTPAAVVAAAAAAACWAMAAATAAAAGGMAGTAGAAAGVGAGRLTPQLASMLRVTPSKKAATASGWSRGRRCASEACAPYAVNGSQ